DDACQLYPYRNFKAELCDLFKLPYKKYNSSKELESGKDLDPFLIEKRKLADAKNIRQFFETKPEKLDILVRTLRRRIDRLKKKSESTMEAEYMPPFLIGQFEVDQNTWSRNGGRLPLNKDLIGGKKNTALPIHYLNVLEVREWLRKRSGNLRLPSEHEWRYAALAGAKTRYFWGDSVEEAKKYCWYRSNSENTLHSKADHANAGNAFGLIDTQGNVGEWAEPMWQPWNIAWQKKDRKDVLRSFSTQLLDKQAIILGGSMWWGLNRSTPDYPWYRFTDENWGAWGFRVAASIR
ncbi:MAG: SUMF1/EgtB/PvdO family nonheme iron enzyme, partial [Planctomycetota bacterium]|nr:SUMF1/EgtB/PvdO family nonheme iron enzyme [Planctomycetota bacterium]